MIKVFFKKESKMIFRYKRLLKKVALETAKLFKMEKYSEVNVIIVDNEKIKEISRVYKKSDKETDVLSFPGDWRNVSKLIGYNMIGDIYISHEKIKEQAKTYNHSIKREWAYLFVHGLLHCWGYDHLNKKDETTMDEIADVIMKKVKVGRHG